MVTKNNLFTVNKWILTTLKSIVVSEPSPLPEKNHYNTSPMKPIPPSAAAVCQP